MDTALSMENVFHKIMLEQCQTEEAKQWEIARHEIMKESIKESCNYYGKCYRYVEHEMEM